MVCERCGHDLTNNYHRSICPVCGTLLPAQTRIHADQLGIRGASSHISEQTRAYAETGAAQVPPPEQKQPPDSPHLNQRAFYAQGTFPTSSNTLFNLRSYNSAFLIELALSLVGIFGIGWLLVGEISIGLTMLICSILIYWPVMFLGTLFTIGLGLLCLGPFAMAAIICNAFLLHSYLKRKNLHP